MNNATYTISAELETNTEAANVDATARLHGALLALQDAGLLSSVEPATGSYEGTRESSFRVTPAAQRAFHAIMALAKVLGQESVLGISPSGTGLLLFTAHDSEALNIGRYQSIASVEGVEAWTRIHETGELYTFA